MSDTRGLSEVRCARLGFFELTKPDQSDTLGLSETKRATLGLSTASVKSKSQMRQTAVD